MERMSVCLHQINLWAEVATDLVRITIPIVSIWRTVKIAAVGVAWHLREVYGSIAPAGDGWDLDVESDGLISEINPLICLQRVRDMTADRPGA
jgi:hypothetical protein